MTASSRPLSYVPLTDVKCVSDAKRLLQTDSKDEKPIIVSEQNEELNESATQVIDEQDFFQDNKDVKQTFYTSDKMASFFVDASKGQGILISACRFHPSGCHSFGEDIHKKFPKLLHIKSIQDQAFKPQYLYKKTTQNSNHWNNIFYTGCILNKSNEVVKRINDIIKLFNISQLESIYLISPPHMQTESIKKVGLNNNITHLNGIKVIYKQTTMITASMDETDPSSIGLPHVSLLNQDEKFEINKNCYGLIYVRHALAYVQNNSLQFSIDDYFTYIKTIKGVNERPSVMMIGPPQDFIKKYAAKNAIEVEFTPRLSQSQFIKTIQDVGKKGGAIYTDGAYTHMQAFREGVFTFFYAIDINCTYVNELARLAAHDSKTQNATRFLLRKYYDNEDISSITNNHECLRVLGLFKEIITKSNEYFNKSYNNYCATQSNKRYHSMLSGDDINKQKKPKTSHSKSITASVDLKRISNS